MSVYLYRDITVAPPLTEHLNSFAIFHCFVCFKNNKFYFDTEPTANFTGRERQITFVFAGQLLKVGQMLAFLFGKYFYFKTLLLVSVQKQLSIKLTF